MACCASCAQNLPCESDCAEHSHDHEPTEGDGWDSYGYDWDQDDDDGEHEPTEIDQYDGFEYDEYDGEYDEEGFNPTEADQDDYALWDEDDIDDEYDGDDFDEDDMDGGDIDGEFEPTASFMPRGWNQSRTTTNDELTGLDPESHWSLEQATGSYVAALEQGVPQDTALANAAEAIGYGGASLGEGVEMIEAYYEGRIRWESYQEALRVNLAQAEVVRNGQLTQEGVLELVNVVDLDGDGALEPEDNTEVAQYLLVRAAVDEALESRCGGLDRGTCLSRNDDPEAILSQLLYGVLASQNLELSVYAPPQQQEPVLSQEQPAPPQRQPRPRDPGRGDGATRLPRFRFPFPGRSSSQGSSQGSHEQSSAAQTSAAQTPEETPRKSPKKGGAWVFDLFRGKGGKKTSKKTSPKKNKTKGESPAARRAREEREARARRSFGLHNVRGSLPNKGGARAQLAVRAHVPFVVDRSTPAPHNHPSMRGYHYLVEKPVSLSLTLRQWAMAEKLFVEVRRDQVDRGEVERFVNLAKARLGWNRHKALSYFLGRVRFDRFDEALRLTRGGSSDRSKVAMGTFGAHDGASCVRTRMGGQSYLKPRCYFDRGEEGRRFASFSKHVGNKPKQEKVWRQAWEHGKELEIIPPPPMVGFFESVIGMTATNTDDADNPGLVDRLLGWFSGSPEAANLEELDQQMQANTAPLALPAPEEMQPTACGCVGPTASDDFDADYDQEDYSGVLLDLYPTAADLSQGDQELALRLAKTRKGAKELAIACLNGDAGACSKIPALAREMDVAELLRADDPRAVAQAALEMGEGEEDEGLLARFEGWVNTVEEVLASPGELVTAWQAQLVARWEALRAYLQGWAQWLDPAAWWVQLGLGQPPAWLGGSQDDPEVLPPTSADASEDDDDDWGLSELATVFAVGGVVLGLGSMATVAYVAPQVLPQVAEHYSDFLSELARNADDIVAAVVPSKDIVRTVGNALR